MHYYDCPCDECRVTGPSNRLLERALTVIERLELELAHPPTRECDRALAWLGRVCGGPDAVAALDTAPLADAPPVPAGQRPEAVADLLDAVAREYFDEEMRLAFRRALVAAWEADRGLVLGPVLAAYVAAGIAWTVGEANGLVGAHHQVTSARLKHYLDTTSGPGTYARPFRRALGEEWSWAETQPRWGWAPYAPSELLALGRTDLLLARTRERLIRVRDHALGERAADNAA